MAKSKKEKIFKLRLKNAELRGKVFDLAQRIQALELALVTGTPSSAVPKHIVYGADVYQ